MANVPKEVRRKQKDIVIYNVSNTTNVIYILLIIAYPSAAITGSNNI